MKPMSGVYPIVVTTFHEDGRLDLESQIQLVDYLLEVGAHGLGLFGNASEGYTLLAEERRVLLELIAKRVSGRVPLVVSTGHTGTDAAVAASKEAADYGADALMVLPPYFLKTDGEGLMHYFDAISKAVPVPIMVQDAPLLTQVAMPPALLARMGREIEQVKLVKVEAPPTAPKFSAIPTDAGLTLFGGLNGNFLIEEHQRGSRGVMPGSDMIPQLVKLWNQLETGETEAAWDGFTKLLPLIRYELQPGLGVSAMKHNLAEAGVIRSTRVRHPTASLDAAGLKELQTLRERLAAT